MTDNSDIQAALDSRDWSGAEVVNDRPRAKIVHSVRLPAEWSEALEAEADRRGTNPSRLMQDYILAGLQRDSAAPEGIVTISRAALHQALDAALTNAA
ncbi:hypothetical protein [Actinoplanes awajinensis]|uniref:Uncharacterized protein n=1 Tax=Actinoplanes awajinensis subsp. mycoplanecinus TaxID=135947 RepID=A0A117MMP4_9ACTN|nr:hypothetical protein [Actinoplanes awajinensis]KUL25840.1 hypothetical protein ADL15_39735 [Actinoplanes awajinensis subsp. mycoplanecinus]